GRPSTYILLPYTTLFRSIADMLRRAHLSDGVPWREMAVVVRSVPSMLPTLRRGLLAAGIPVVTDGGELPLARRYGPGAMLSALRDRKSTRLNSSHVSTSY